MSLLSFEDRQRIRELVDAAKRHEIATAHGRAINGIRRIAFCEVCGGMIESTRRFCDQACINTFRREQRKRRRR